MPFSVPTWLDEPTLDPLLGSDSLGFPVPDLFPDVTPMSLMGWGP